jgi:hypothetical protein
MSMPGGTIQLSLNFSLTLRMSMESSSFALIATVHVCLNFPVAEHEAGLSHDEGYRYAMLCPLLRSKEEKR